jgi:hypothetical protein
MSAPAPNAPIVTTEPRVAFADIELGPDAKRALDDREAWSAPSIGCRGSVAAVSQGSGFIQISSILSLAILIPIFAVSKDRATWTRGPPPTRATQEDIPSVASQTTCASRPVVATTGVTQWAPRSASTSRCTRPCSLDASAPSPTHGRWGHERPLYPSRRRYALGDGARSTPLSSAR